MRPKNSLSFRRGDAFVLDRERFIDVLVDIRAQMWRNNETPKTLAEKYGISEKTMHAIFAGMSSSARIYSFLERDFGVKIFEIGNKSSCNRGVD